ncbi:superoxide dismutase family protein [Bacillus suaedaesalsae]|uniref:Superoxide dismutase [Cu-Zn] n=1 Tax=Bacillus suaedaesalsae TaxID=2810349 RepID=A0ABS2DJQ1_9BACI|nr:superoxide dismutase family protein [Bacillus suaedaesalsae]MBM6618726.1 superoxide dismutase family protein [Bacillus suaedaesalsae]
MKRLLLLSLLLLMSGCGEYTPTKIMIDIKNPDGDTMGTATLQEKATGLSVGLDLKGLEPGPHAIHFHQTGKCEPPDYESAGEHYNPEDKDHGLLNPEGSHAGDLPNIIAESDGTVLVELMAPGVTLKEGKTSLFIKEGTSLVIHEKADDGMSQPAGNGGKRIACGVISLEEQMNKDKKKEKVVDIDQRKKEEGK